MKNAIVFILIALCVATSATAAAPALPPPPPIPAPATPQLPIPGNIEIAEVPFKPTVESLRQYRCPEWFRDAKFGIWSHWGPQSVPMNSGWYARHMYVEGGGAYLYHLAHYGHPSVFGYKDIIQLWKAEKFDPDRLVSLYQAAGAKYFVAQANHHDNFDNWDSKYHEWNSVNYGPHKNIVGLWREAALKAGLRFGITTHAERTWSWFQVNKGADTNGPYQGVPYDGNDPRYQHLYLPKDPTGDTSPSQALNSPPAWRQEWLARINDVVDRYHPDVMYVDGAVPFQGDDQAQTGMRMIANLYNGSVKNHNGTNEAVMCAKAIRNHGIWLDGILTQTCERSGFDNINDQPWQSDDTLGGWFYRPGIHYDVTGGTLIRNLVNIVSKNGTLLLNICQRPDGSIDPDAEKELAAIGAWLKINGEAIYATRPWEIFGEGPNLHLPPLIIDPTGNKRMREKVVFTFKDIRFTRSKDGKTLYAIALGWPQDGKLLVKSVANGAGKINEVSLLGYTGKLDWQQTPEGLAVTLPKEMPSAVAGSLKIIGETLTPVVTTPAHPSPANKSTR